jgi:uncharacterized protein (TIGR03435 family)
MRSALCLLAFACRALVAQTPADLTFEAAAVKLHVDGGPGTTGRTGIQEGPGQVRIENLSLRTLVAIAYGLKGREQLVGPDWMSNLTFDVVAKPPAEYKHEQFATLLRNLLTERFHLAVHQESRPISGFALIVAKGGPKLHESAGPRTFLTGRPGLIEGNQRSIAELASNLANQLGSPVVDHTGLTARYDLKVEWTPDDSSAAGDPVLSLFTALQDQLGLKLEPQKMPANVVIVDHVDRVPTGN